MKIQCRFESQLSVRLALALIQNVHISTNRNPFDQTAGLARTYHQRYADTEVHQIQGIQQARRFFRALGIDPTRRRPASEALLQRALKQKALPKINTAVDVGNWCALDFLLPTCVYDFSKIKGIIRIREGAENETYKALNNREIHAQGRYILADDDGPFGSPITDSQRTCVSPHTRNVLLGIWGPDDIAPEYLLQQLDLFSRRIIEYCGGEKTDSGAF